MRGIYFLTPLVSVSWRPFIVQLRLLLPLLAYYCCCCSGLLTELNINYTNKTEKATL